MALPTLIAVQGTYLKPDGTPEAGTVVFRSSTLVRDGASDDVMAPGAISGVLDASGNVTLSIPATDDPAWSPVGWTWTVHVRLTETQATFQAVVPYDAPGAVLDLSDLLPAQPAGGELYAGYGHTHSGYVSADDLTTGLASKLDKANGQVTDSTLEIRKGDGSSGVRFRSTGGAVDVDKLNGDIVVSSFAGPGYGGTQTGLQRWRSTGTTLAGLTEFGGTVYQGQQSINASNGTANFLDTTVASLSVTGAVSGGAFNATLRPVDHALAGWTFDPAMVQAGTILATAGVSHIVRLRATAATITNIVLHFTAGGATLTAGQCFASLHTDAGVLLSSTADQATSWAGGGLKTMALAAAQAVTVGNWYKVRFWFNGTTGPTLSRAVNSSTAIVNVGLSAPNFRYATADTGLTTAGAAPTTIGTQTGGATAWWVGLS